MEEVLQNEIVQFEGEDVTFEGIPLTFAMFVQVLDLISVRNNKYATDTEDGANRFRRLRGLGYV